MPLGADWNLVRADGSETVSARYLIRTHDGVLLSVLNEGVIADRLTPVTGGREPGLGPICRMARLSAGLEFLPDFSQFVRRAFRGK